MDAGRICCDCRTPFIPLKNDIIVNEINTEGKSIKLWCADLWECPSCETRLITGFGQKPYAVHFEPDYLMQLQNAKDSGVMFTACGTRGPMRKWDGATN